MECQRCLLDDSIPGVVIGRKQNEVVQCNYCDLHDELEKQYPISEDKYKAQIEDIRKRGKGRKYDCLLGISGGSDSSWLLHELAMVHKLRVLAIHYDNCCNTHEAIHNIETMVSETKVDFINFTVGIGIFPKLCKAFIVAGVPEGDIPNDIAMAKIMIDTAIAHGIPTIINGHDFRTEGSTPLGWTYMDGKYLESVAKESDVDITGFPILSIKDQLKAARAGVKQVRPFYYCKPDNDGQKKLLTAKYGWKDYGGKHGENIYTAFIGGYYLPRRFNIDKRRVYFSARIRSGYMTKEEAKTILMMPSIFHDGYVDFACKLLGVSRSWLNDTMNLGDKHTCKDYATYQTKFKRWKVVFWLLTKIGIFPQTFYKKYCRGV